MDNMKKSISTIKPGESFNMVSSINYSDGSVVSKTIVDKKTGTLTLFAFDKDQGLSEHTAPYDAIVEIIDGKCEITIDGEPRTVSNGEMIIMPANHPHALRAVEKFKMILIMIKA